VNGSCVGTPKCEQVTCQNVTCDPNVGICNSASYPNGSSCGISGELCSESCQSGVCSQNPVTCPNATVCTTYSCDPTSGNCVPDYLDGNSCDDGNPCTANDSCHTGVCAGTNLTCLTSSLCELGICNTTLPPLTIFENFTAICTTIPNVGADCTDPTDNCTLSSCTMNGTCVPYHYNNCSSLNVTFCEVAFCTKSICSIDYSFKNGTPCDDYNNCTVNDTCTINGTCAGVTGASNNISGCVAAKPPVVVPQPSSYVIAPTIAASAVLALIAGAFLLFRKPISNAPQTSGTADNGQINAVANNPTYEGANKSGNNPLYEANQ